MKLYEVHDNRPLSVVAERLSDYKRVATRWKREQPKRFAAAATAATVGVLAPGIGALIVGVSDDPEPRENTTGVDEWLGGVWENLLRPTVGDPLISWSETHLVTGTSLPAYAPVILWALVGALAWLGGLGRSVYAKVVWPFFGAATTVMAHAGAVPGRAVSAAGAVVLLWLLLSLPVYRRRKPRSKPEPRPPWRETTLRQAEHYKRLLDMAVPGSKDHQIIRHYLNSEVRSLVKDAQREHAQDWAEILSSGKRSTTSMALAGAGGYLFLALPMLAAGATVLGVIVALLSLPLLAMGLVEHSEDETEPVRLGQTPIDQVQPTAMPASAASEDNTETPSETPVNAR